MLMMKEGRVERFLLLPFSFGCDSHSSVAVAATATAATTTTGGESSKCSKTGIKSGEENLCRTKIKKNQRFWKLSFSQGFHRLIKGFKSFSQFFVYKEEEEEEEKELEIGFPTDVKHLTHIGLDGSTTVINPVMPNWETLKPAETMSFPSSVSLQQFESAMAAQAQASLQTTAPSNFT